MYNKFLNDIDNFRENFKFYYQLYMLENYEIDFNISTMILRTIFEYCINYNEDEKKLNQFFHLDKDNLKEYFEDTHISFDHSDSAVLLWGGVYFYQFLEESGLIDKSSYDNAILVINSFKEKFRKGNKESLWLYRFIFNIVKPNDKITQEEIDKEINLFENSFHQPYESSKTVDDIFWYEL